VVKTRDDNQNIGGNIKPNRSIRISILPGVWTTSLDIADVVHIPAVIEPGNTLGLCGTTRFSGFGRKLPYSYY
jgi:hypothetical protein